MTLSKMSNCTYISVILLISGHAPGYQTGWRLRLRGLPLLMMSNRRSPVSAHGRHVGSTMMLMMMRIGRTRLLS